MSDNEIDLLEATKALTNAIGSKVNQSNKKVSDDIDLVRTNQEHQKAFIKRFVKMESWLILSEAIPICLGYGKEYEAYATGDKDYLKIKDLVQSLAANDLDIIDHHLSIKEWRVNPKDFVRWLSNNDQFVIDELCIHFLSKKNSSVKPKNKAVSDAQSERHALVRESIYKAVIYILAHYPDQCRDLKGSVVAAKIERVLQLKSTLWFEDKKEDGDGIPLSGKNIRALINDAIREVKKVK